MTVVLLAAGVLAAWLALGRAVRRDRGKVRLSETEMILRRLLAQVAALEKAMGEQIRPAMLRATAAMRELHRVFGLAP